jgi:hypothetical protein
MGSVGLSSYFGEIKEGEVKRLEAFGNTCWPRWQRRVPTSDEQSMKCTKRQVN